MINDQIVFIADLNELENGSELPVSMDYTCNAGAGVFSSLLRRPSVGDWVYVHSDDDNALFWAQVISVGGDRDLVVRVDWATRTKILNNPDWSAQNVTLWANSRQSVTAGDSELRVS